MKILSLILLPLLISLDVNNNNYVNKFLPIELTITNGKENYSTTERILYDDENQEFLLKKLYVDNSFKGYYVINDNNEVEIIQLLNKDFEINNDTYYLSGYGLISKNEIKKVRTFESSDNTPNISTISDSESQIDVNLLPYIYGDLIDSRYNSFSSTTFITETPYYNNKILNKANYCSPISTTMFLAFISNKSVDLTNLYPETMPISHSENISLVNNKINEMAKLVKTNKSGMTDYRNVLRGINDFLSSKDKRFYSAFYTTKIADIKTIMLNGQNPILARTAGHMALGVGYADIRYNGEFIVTHDPSVKEEVFTYMSRNVFLGGIYISQ